LSHEFRGYKESF
jgi:hypothetical protein